MLLPGDSNGMGPTLWPGSRMDEFRCRKPLERFTRRGVLLRIGQVVSDLEHRPG